MSKEGNRITLQNYRQISAWMGIILDSGIVEPELRAFRRKIKAEDAA